MKLKRSQQKNITRDAQILRYMRISRGKSLNESGKIVRISGSAIAHIEQGRMDISRERMKTLIAAYGYTMEDYLEFHDGKTIPTNLRDECIVLLRRCDESRIQILHPLIANLSK